MNKVLCMLALVAVGLLAGCADAPPSPLTVDAARKLRLQNIAVTVDNAANVNWANAENDFFNKVSAGQPKRKQQVVETASLGPQDASTEEANRKAELLKSPEGKAFMNERISERLTQALDKSLRPKLSDGARAVKLEVAVHDFIIPSAVQRVVIGGQPVISASAKLVDAATGEVLAERPKLISVAYAGNGWAGVLVDQMFDDLETRVVDAYANQYGDWLVPKT